MTVGELKKQLENFDDELTIGTNFLNTDVMVSLRQMDYLGYEYVCIEIEES